ncbi:MAG: zinc ribbon domain-containing protein [Candidatus Omnitrophica bacterium]|nr:zinc ribbon domain-containing protein [Candidatus Omnitrophota bacterium]
MPIYCYRCEDCGFGFEKLVRASEEKPEACPKCRGKTKKEFAPFSIGRGSSSPSPASGGSSCAGCRSGSCGSCSSGHH